MPPKPRRPAASASPEDPAERLAGQLRAARARLGKTVRQMGELTGIPWTSLAALEGGREPRWSTLMRYLETVPGLRASQLLPPPHPAPPAASRSVHEFLLDAYGYRARRVSVEVRPADGGRRVVETRVEGMRWTGRPADRATILSRLLVACGERPREILSDLLNPPLHEKQLRFPKDKPTWTYRIGGTEDAPEVSCHGVATEEGEATRVLVHLGIPAESLELVLHAGGASRRLGGRVVAYPTARGAEGEAADISACLHPEGLEVSASGRALRTRIPCPMPDLTYVLVLADGSEAPAESRESSAPELAELVRRLRERAGCSTRELARRMNVSHATVLAAERGRDASAGTLRAFLAALPGTAPQALLPASSPASPATLVEAWEWYREAHLLEAESFEEIRIVRPDGTRERSLTLTGLRSLDPRDKPVKILLSADTGVFSRGSPQLLSIATEAEDDEDDVRVRTYERMAQGVRHVVTIPGRRSRKGLTLSESRLNQGKVALNLAEGQARNETKDPDIVIGGSSTVSIPTRRLVHELRLPPNARVRDPYVACKPVALAAVRLDTSWLEHLHAGAYRVEFDLLNGRLRLEVENPLCGFSYGFGAFLA